jgi:hypothetical protein
MDDSNPPGRRLKLTLVVRDEKDDHSILDIVRVALEDGLRSPAIGSPTSTQEKPSEPPDIVERNPVGEMLETAAREVVEEALAKVIERFQAVGEEPSFGPANWAKHLSQLWAVADKAKAAGVQLHVTIPESQSAED